MKKRRFKRMVSILLILCMIFLCSPFAHAEDTSISRDELLGLAILHYYSSIEEEKRPNIDSYYITPLYDDDEQIQYYCVDFFEGDAGKGYVVIATDISNVLCPEIAYEDNSVYYQNVKNGKTNIYFNPFERYTVTKETRNTPKKYFDKNENEISFEKLQGEVIKGDKRQNEQIHSVVESSGAAAPSGNLQKATFTENPIYYLESLNFGNITPYKYSTLEKAMVTAGALDYTMYTPENSTIKFMGVPLPGGTVLWNEDHCAITAMTKVLAFWRPKCCSKYPESINSIFEKLLVKSEVYGAFDKDYIKKGPDDTDGYFQNAYIDNVLLAVNASCGYSGRVFYDNHGDFSFLVQQIEGYGWPVIISFGESAFKYSSHAVVAFGYNSVTCEKGATTYLFRFAKVTDGLEATPKYISWDIVENCGVDSLMWGFCPYGG